MPVCSHLAITVVSFGGVGCPISYIWGIEGELAGYSYSTSKLTLNVGN